MAPAQIVYVNHLRVGQNGGCRVIRKVANT